MPSSKDWPRQVGSGWNTSDGYRFRHEERAHAHQERTTRKPARFGAPANAKARAQNEAAPAESEGDE